MGVVRQRWRRWTAAMIVGAAVMPWGRGQDARAGEAHPICRAWSVVDVMARELAQRDHYARIERSLIAENDSTQANIVLCSVWARTLRYEAARYGNLPVVYIEAHEFRVQALTDGYVVEFLR